MKLKNIRRPGSAGKILALVAVGGLLFGAAGRMDAGAQELVVARNESNVSLGQITDAFIRNMTLLDQLLSANMHNEETHQMMLAVIAKADDVGRYYRARGGGEKRRQLLEEVEKLKKRAGFNKSDQTRLNELNKQIQESDPEGLFGKSRSSLNVSVGELQRCLGMYQTADVTVTDLIRLIREHLGHYQMAMGRYR